MPQCLRIHAASKQPHGAPTCLVVAQPSGSDARALKFERVSTTPLNLDRKAEGVARSEGPVLVLKPDN